MSAGRRNGWNGRTPGQGHSTTACDLLWPFCLVEGSFVLVNTFPTSHGPWIRQAQSQKRPSNNAKRNETIHSGTVDMLCRYGYRTDYNWRTRNHRLPSLASVELDHQFPSLQRPPALPWTQEMQTLSVCSSRTHPISGRPVHCLQGTVQIDSMDGRADVYVCTPYYDFIHSLTSRG